MVTAKILYLKVDFDVSSCVFFLTINECPRFCTSYSVFTRNCEAAEARQSPVCNYARTDTDDF